jgi:SAM-dependent methyltransferase
VLLVFLPPDLPASYGSRIARLRWRQALGVSSAVEPAGEEDARALLSGHRCAVFVRDETAIPAPVVDPGSLLERRIASFLPFPAAGLRTAHTLRELELSGVPTESALQPDRSRIPAVGFDPECLPAGEGETITLFARRLFGEAGQGPFPEAFRAVVFEEPAEHERPELTALFPARTRNLCDVGCGSGAAGAAFRRRVPEARVTGIESHPPAASLARARLDRLLEEDAVAALKRLAAQGERFDGFLFADILEHLTDPISALEWARRCAGEGALLVASVPNVGHLSLVRDLVLGRFDPLPAGLTDVGHLRWFDRRFLQEALEEAGWRVDRIEGLEGAPPPDAGTFLSRLEGWSNLDRASLRTYQWVAACSAQTRSQPRPGRSTSSTGRLGDSLLGALDAPKCQHLELDAVNRFRGMVLDTREQAGRLLRVSADGRLLGEFPRDLPSEDVARHLPALPAARHCRFEFDLFVPGDASRVDLEVSIGDGGTETLFELDLPEIRRGREERRAMERALAVLPMPTPEVVFLTQGHYDVAGYKDSMIPGLVNTQRYLREAGVDVARIENLLDFGCGSGRLLAGWLLESDRRGLYGCDINEVLVSWAREHLPPSIRIDRTGPAPPLPYSDGQFDLVTAVSVFTHLGLTGQRLWCSELARVLRPGGTLLLTLHGEPYVRLFLANRLEEFERVGHLEIEASAEGTNQSSSFHHPEAVARLFPEFEILGFHPTGRLNGKRVLSPLAAWQDVYVLRRRADPSARVA